MFGLLLCCVGSVFNVFTDASRKKVLDRKHDAALVSLCCKLVAFVCYGFGLGCLFFLGVRPSLASMGASLHLSPLMGFVIYLALNALLEGTAILLNYRALQVAPLSLCAPFLTLTAVFLLPVGKIFLHETISTGMIIGVFLVLIGSVVINRKLFANGLLEPARAILREKGSRYMTIVALLLTCTAALDKWFVTSGTNATFTDGLARAFTLCMGKCVMLSLFFAGLVIIRLGVRKNSGSGSKDSLAGGTGSEWGRVWRDVPAWLVLAGVFEAAVLVLQLTALQFEPAAIVLSIKRSGILLACAVGWFMFKERGMTDRIIGSFVMLAGVLVFFLTKPGAGGQSGLSINFAGEIAVAALTGMAIALYLTRHRNKPLEGLAPADVACINLKPLGEDEV